MLDIASAGAEFILGKMKQSMISMYLKAIFAMTASGIITFLFVCGSALVGDAPWPKAIGAGMLSSSLVIVGAFLATDLAKKVALILPKILVAQQKLQGLEEVKKEKKDEASTANPSSAAVPARPDPAAILSGRG